MLLCEENCIKLTCQLELLAKLSNLLLRFMIQKFEISWFCFELIFEFYANSNVKFFPEVLEIA